VIFVLEGAMSIEEGKQLKRRSPQSAILLHNRILYATEGRAFLCVEESQFCQEMHSQCPTFTSMSPFPKERLSQLSHKYVHFPHLLPYKVYSKFSSHICETKGLQSMVSRLSMLLSDST
jgi:hypothetical protein